MLQNPALAPAEGRWIPALNVLPAEEERFGVRLSGLAQRVPSRKVIGFLVDMHDVGLKFAHLPPERRIVMQVVIPVEAYWNRPQLITGRETAL